MCTLRESNPYGAVYNISPRLDKHPTLSLAARKVSAGLLAIKAKPLRGGLRPALTAPTPRGVRQLREEQGENRTPINHRFSNQPCAFQDQLNTPGSSERIPQEDAMAR